MSQFSVSNGEVAELQADLGTLFAQQLNTDAMRIEQICATTKEDLDLDGNQQHTVEQIVDVLVSAERNE